MEKNIKKEVIKIISVTVVGVTLILLIPYLFNYFRNLTVIIKN